MSNYYYYHPPQVLATTAIRTAHLHDSPSPFVAQGTAVPNFYRDYDGGELTANSYAYHQSHPHQYYSPDLSSNPYGFEYYYGDSQPYSYQVPYAYHFDGNYPGSYFVQLGGGSLVSVPAIVSAPTHRDQQITSTRLRKNRKKMEYVSACRGSIKKYKKHSSGRGNETHRHKTLFDKYHLGYFGKVGVRYFHKHMNLSKQKRTGTSSLQNDITEKVGLEEDDDKEKETLGYNLNDEAPLEVQFEDDKVFRNKWDQVFDESPQQNRTGVDELQSVKRDEEKEETLRQLESGKPEDEKLEDNEYQMLDQILQMYGINVMDMQWDESAGDKPLELEDSERKSEIKEYKVFDISSLKDEDGVRDDEQLRVAGLSPEETTLVHDEDVKQFKGSVHQIFDKFPQRDKISVTDEQWEDTTGDVLLEIKDEEFVMKLHILFEFCLKKFDADVQKPGMTDADMPIKLRAVENSRNMMFNESLQRDEEPLSEGKSLNEGQGVTFKSPVTFINEQGTYRKSLTVAIPIGIDLNSNEAGMINSPSDITSVKTISVISTDGEYEEVRMASKLIKEMFSRKTISRIALICCGIDRKVRFSEIAFAADLDSNNLSLLIEVYAKTTLLDLGQSLYVWCMNSSHDSSRFIETNEVFTDAKRCSEKREWNGLFEIENEGDNSV